MRWFWALTLMAGCAMPPGTPVPQAVRLSDRVVTLRLSDGTTCRADWQAAPAGRFGACGPGFGYAVAVEDRPNLLRQLVEEVDLALGAGLFPPMAEVVITDPAGIDTVFVLPPPVVE